MACVTRPRMVLKVRSTSCHTGPCFWWGKCLYLLHCNGATEVMYDAESQFMRREWRLQFGWSKRCPRLIVQSVSVPRAWCMCMHVCLLRHPTGACYRASCSHWDRIRCVSCHPNWYSAVAVTACRGAHTHHQQQHHHHHRRTYTHTRAQPFMKRSARPRVCVSISCSVLAAHTHCRSAFAHDLHVPLYVPQKTEPSTGTERACCEGMATKTWEIVTREYTCGFLGLSTCTDTETRSRTVHNCGAPCHTKVERCDPALATPWGVMCDRPANVQCNDTGFYRKGSYPGECRVSGSLDCCVVLASTKKKNEKKKHTRNITYIAFISCSGGCAVAHTVPNFPHAHKLTCGVCVGVLWSCVVCVVVFRYVVLRCNCLCGCIRVFLVQPCDNFSCGAGQ